MKLTIALPPKLRPVFSGKADVRGAYGGRGSAKTRSFALMTAVRAYKWAMEGSGGVILCGRQFMNSLAESSLEEIKAAIREMPELMPHFDIGEKYIRTAPHLPGRIDYVFAGLDRNVDSIKSKARIRLGWIDEAEPVSETAWVKLIPTLREEDSELWVTWNPESDESPTHKRFRLTHDPLIRVVEMNWRDNPKFPAKLNRDRLRDLAERPDIYEHVWEGAFLTRSDALVLRGRHTVAEFEPAAGWDGPYYGADWGFSVDPTAFVRCWIHGRILYIEYEAYGHGVEIDNLPALFRTIPDAERYATRGDNARPETISYMQRHGFPHLIAADKWPGSVEDGVEFLRSFERIVIHRRCEHTAREARLWTYKVDRLTGEVKPDLLPGNDHIWDGVRYALSPVIRKRNPSRFTNIPHMAR